MNYLLNNELWISLWTDQYGAEYLKRYRRYGHKLVQNWLCAGRRRGATTITKVILNLVLHGKESHVFRPCHRFNEKFALFRYQGHDCLLLSRIKYPSFKFQCQTTRVSLEMQRVSVPFSLVHASLAVSKVLPCNSVFPV